MHTRIQESKMTLAQTPIGYHMPKTLGCPVNDKTLQTRVTAVERNKRSVETLKQIKKLPKGITCLEYIRPDGDILA